MFIRIIAQYQENYGFSEGNESWKNKGGEEFIWKPSESDYFYNDKAMDVRVATELLRRASNSACRYILVTCEREYMKTNDVSVVCDEIYASLLNVDKKINQP